MAKEYKSPKVKRMNAINKGMGDCLNGSGDTSECFTGNSAAEYCLSSGNSAGWFCEDPGNSEG